MQSIFFKTWLNLRRIPLEAYLWIAALTYLMFIDPLQTQHFSLCPFNNIGIDFCPGCGLGKSISFIYHFDFMNSIKTHPLGIAALIIILYRIVTLIYKSYSAKYSMEVQNG